MSKNNNNNNHPSSVLAGVLGAAILGGGLYLLAKGAQSLLGDIGQAEQPMTVQQENCRPKGTVRIVTTGTGCADAVTILRK